MKSSGCFHLLHLCGILLLLGNAGAFVPLICPLAPLAPVWAAGKAAIMTRKKFFPESEPWPREWEENDIWFEKSKAEKQVQSLEKVGKRGKPEGGGPPPSCPAYRETK